jgi:serine/threonine protein kinase/tetratricopeptide (TPR) repeat protein
MDSSDLGLPADDFLELPAIAPLSLPRDLALFQKGDVLAERFRIVRFLGSGGMGEVYEALDLELSTAVALKTIRAELADDARAIERFRGEVLRARTVSHHHVCRVHDLFAHQTGSATVRFLTMELLDGETLAARLAAEGALPVALVSMLAVQIGSAVDEAHRLGIIHRDLKPGNVMLVGHGAALRAVVTDFGLAHRLVDPSCDAGMTALSERQAGTATYMAPEIWAGGIIGPASDLYSFGVIVHEMLTGYAPDGDASGAAARCVARSLPRSWRRMVEACLSTNPARRPGSAVEAMRTATGLRARLRRQAWMTLTGMVALLALAFYAPLLRSLTWRADLRPGAALVMADIANGTDEPEIDTLTELLRRQLEQSKYVSLVSRERVDQALATMTGPAGAPLTIERARELLWRGAGDAFVSGRTWRSNQAYGLSVRIESRPVKPDVVGRNWSRAYEARNRTELLARIRDAANWIRTSVGEATTDIPQNDRPVAEVTTSSWQALHLYSRAEQLLAGGRQEDGLALLAESTRLDPDFALGWMRMGDVLMSRGQFEEAYDRWEQALNVSKRRQLTPREEYRIRGLYASDTHDYVEAERIYRVWLLSYPADARPLFYIARPLLMLGRTGDAIKMLEAAWQKEPYLYYIPVHLAMFQLRAGRSEDVPALIVDLKRMGQGAWAECLQGQLDFLVGRYKSALGHFEHLEAVDHPLLRSRSTVLQASVLAELGRTGEAIAALERGVSADVESGDRPSRADKLLALASLHLRLSHARVCRDLCVQVEQLDRSTRRLAQSAVLLARAGYPADAAAVLSRLDAKSTVRSVQVDRQRIKGEILLARGQPKTAWAAFQQAGALDAPGIPHEYLARSAVAAREEGTALALYSRMASDPGYYWHYPDAEPPGAWSDALDTYLRLAKKTDPRHDVAAAETRYRALRPTLASRVPHR